MSADLRRSAYLTAVERRDALARVSKEPSATIADKAEAQKAVTDCRGMMARMIALGDPVPDVIEAPTATTATTSDDTVETLVAQIMSA